MAEPTHPTEPAVEKKRSPSLDAMLRHPLAAIVIGFLLTGVVGTAISDHLAEQRQREAEAARLRDARRDAVRGLSQMYSERLMRMQMLMIAIDQHSPADVIKKVKGLYDEAEQKAAGERAANLLLVREVLGPADYDKWHSELETRVLRKRLVPLKECLEKATAAAIDGKDGAAILKQGNAEQLFQQIQAGSDAFVDGLYDLAVATQSSSAADLTKARESVLKRIEQACP